MIGKRVTHERPDVAARDDHRVDPGALATLSEPEKNRLRMRRAGVWSAIAFERARLGEDPKDAARRALDALAAVDKSELSDVDGTEYHEAAIRVGASRWAAALPVTPNATKPHVATEPGEPRQTCVLLLDASHDRSAPLARRCTWGVAWIASQSVSHDGRAVALAVQPLAGWRELWLFRRGEDGWSIDVLPPTPASPEVGYVEFAGWDPGSTWMLLVREARDGERLRRSFEILSLDTLNVEKKAGAPSLLAAFGRWQDPAWRRGTVSVR